MQAEPIIFQNIACEPTRLLERNRRGQAQIVVLRKSIDSIALRRGFLSPHPVLQLVVGGAMTLPFVLPIVHVIRWLQHGGTLVDAELALVPLGAIGLWLSWTSFRTGCFLDVKSTQGRKRLVFQTDDDLPAANAFADAVERAYELRIDRDTPERL